MKLWKLTTADGYTRKGLYGETKWEVGKTVSAKGSAKQPLCSNGWIHAYEHKLIAVLMNAAHANIKHPLLWEIKGIVGRRNGQLKCGCREVTPIRIVPIPAISNTQKVRFAILAGLEARPYSEEWKNWAERWLSGSDRTNSSGYTFHAIQTAYFGGSSHIVAGYSHVSAVCAANYVAGNDSDFRFQVSIDTYVAHAACYAQAANQGKDINFISIAERAMREEC